MMTHRPRLQFDQGLLQPVRSSSGHIIDHGPGPREAREAEPILSVQRALAEKIRNPERLTHKARNSPAKGK
jgi:hypothetical protein